PATTAIFPLSLHDALPIFTTFGGNPVSCAASLATLEVIMEERLLDQVEHKGSRFEEQLRHPAIKAMRRIGLMMAIDFGTADDVQDRKSTRLNSSHVKISYA